MGGSVCCALVSCSADSDCAEGACAGEDCEMGGVDNDANGLANAADPYCQGIIYGDINKQPRVPCRIDPVEGDICKNNLIGGYCDIPPGENAGVCKSRIINSVVP